MRYTTVDIIYNPNSTGPSGSLAKKLRRQLHKKYPKLDISLRATEHAGHATELAYKAAKSSKHPLVISSSGDGGYNEVINGAMQAQSEGAFPVCAVLAAGNANDHSRTMTNDSLFKLITKGQERSIDLLRLTVNKDDKTDMRYAHSYIGLGLSPVVAAELNKTNLNRVNELWIVAQTFYKYRPFKIMRNKRELILDSLIFANIGEMAKFLTLSKDSKPDDGKFEVIVIKHDKKSELIRVLATAMVTAHKNARQYEKYECTVLKKMPVQLDGEVMDLAKNSKLNIDIEKRVLTTLV